MPLSCGNAWAYFKSNCNILAELAQQVKPLSVHDNFPFKYCLRRQLNSQSFDPPRGRSWCDSPWSIIFPSPPFSSFPPLSLLPSFLLLFSLLLFPPPSCFFSPHPLSPSLFPSLSAPPLKCFNVILVVNVEAGGSHQSIWKKISPKFCMPYSVI